MRGVPIAVQTPLLLKVWKYDAEFTVLTVTQSAKAEMGKLAIKIKEHTEQREYASVYISAFCDSDDHDLLLFLCRSSAAAFMSFFWYLPHCGGARYGALHL